MRTLVCLFLLSFLLFTESLFASGPDLKVSILPACDAFQPGDTVTIGIAVEIPERFHLYGRPLGPGIGKPLHIRIEGAEDVSWSRLRKTPAEKFTPDIGDWVWAYEGKAAFYLSGVLSQTSADIITGKLVLDGLICNTACVPILKTIPFSFKVGRSDDDELFAGDEFLSRNFSSAQAMAMGKEAGSGDYDIMSATPTLSGSSTQSTELSGSVQKTQEQKMIRWDYDPVESSLDFNIPIAVILAFIAGLILNVMPSVLPVLGIKILSHSQGIGGGRKAAFMRSVVFAAGMVSVFMVLASFAAFAGFSWGEQFQTPEMLVTIIAVMVVFALGLFDIYHILVPAGVSALEQKSIGRGYVGDFIKGMLTTILATPCSSPFLGATLAWTLRQTPAVVYLIFAALGIGMAFPYVLLSSSRGLMSLIPRPGRWMNDFKHFMGFLLFGFAAYLMIALPEYMMVSTVLFCVFLACAVFLYGRYAPFGSKAKRRLTTGLITLLVATLGWYISFPLLYHSLSGQRHTAQNYEELWKPFTPDRLRRAHAQGNHVVVNFTADWCMNCQYTKLSTLNTKGILELLDRKDVIALKADLTQKNPAAESLLHHLGSRSIPFMAVFPGDQPFSPYILRNLLRKKRLQTVLKQLPEK